MDTPTQDPTIRLADGRKLGYRILGDPNGKPLFFFHGTPGSRMVLAETDSLAQVPGLCLILPERPGYGLSDPKPDRTLVDWPQDFIQLADHLQLDRFAVAGISGGGPYALVCAHQLQDRVTKALLLSSPSPINFRGATKGLAFGNRLGIWLNRLAPWLLRVLMKNNLAAFEKDPQILVDALGKQMCEPDRRLLKDPVLRQAIIADLQEAYRQGGDAQIYDGRLVMTSPRWGFPLSEITVPVFLWHGEEDTLVTMNMARYLAREIPHCQAHFMPASGHLLTENPQVVEEMCAALEIPEPPT